MTRNTQGIDSNLPEPSIGMEQLIESAAKKL